MATSFGWSHSKEGKRLHGNNRLTGLRHGDYRNLSFKVVTLGEKTSTYMQECKMR
ncbi:hypothetical protein M378DRAFT_155869 [Amanita muscaria Koide BX008]|uniref:Uncharacterized protein n=1 Tax=Amanita muscaria (strain Koide BX008) TaxID=946122 RepID=A0A0C2X970_AMAMK|nr:hypothetical protein M378DRAFT_155869 [Amanita muscaria Koide BX008]